jgi:glycosyltransferase involved in cell wall biosynthesis
MNLLRLHEIVVKNSYHWKGLLPVGQMSPNSIRTLVILSPGFPADENESTCLPAQQLYVRTLNRIFPDLRIIVIALQYPPHEIVYRWYGNEVIPFNSKKYKIFLRPFLWSRVHKRLCEITNLETAGVLSLWYSETALLGKRFARKYNLRHYCWILGQDALAHNHFTRWVRLRPDEIIALSDSLSDEFKRNHGIRPFLVVPNGIDPSQFGDNRFSERTIDVLGVGSLIPLKQYSIFVEVVARLKKKRPGIKAVLCGRGPEGEMLRSQIRRLKIEQNISIMGEIPHNKVLSLMQHSKILLHPSSYEGYSTACLEALYAGCHVVSFTWAEKKTINQWHIVASIEEMFLQCLKILNDTNASPICVHTMEEAAISVIKLFNRQGIIS